MQSQTKVYLQAIAILIGTIVGVGTFGVPYVFSQAGFFVGLAYLGGLGLVVLTHHLLYGEIVLRTPQKHRLIGYAETYFGKGGKYAGALIMVVGILGTLLAYIVVGGLFSKVLFDPLFSLSQVSWSLIFFGIMAFFVVTDFKTGAPAELVMSLLLLIIFIVIIVRTVPDINPAHFFESNSRNLFLPYGVLLFALGGSGAIPELRDVLSGDGRMKKTILAGTLIPAVLYGVFAFGVVGVFGNSVTKDAVTSLAGVYGTWMAVAGGIVGVLTTATSFIVLALALKHAFIFDLALSRPASTALMILAPLVLFIVATHDFVKVIGFIGSVLGGVEGLLMLKMHRVAQRMGKRTPEYSVSLPAVAYGMLACMFAAGIIYEMVYTLH